MSLPKASQSEPEPEMLGGGGVDSGRENPAGRGWWARDGIFA